MGILHIGNSGNKAGRNIEVDAGPADIWDGGHVGDVSLVWLAPTAARIHQLVSSSTSDDGDPVGVGARTVRVFYLPDWDTEQTSIDVTLNGTGNVALPAMVMINHMEVLTNGGTNINAGVIKATAAVDGTITSQIRASQGYAQNTIYGIPSSQSMLMHRLYANINRNVASVAGAVDIALLVNPNPDVEPVHFRTEHPFGLTTIGTSALTIKYGDDKIIRGPAIIKVNAISGTANMDVSAGYDFDITDNIN